MMKIKRLSIKNYLGIQELDIEPGKVNIIHGRVGKGKTSILEAIEKGFTNNDRRPRVIRDGADQALILIETDEGLTVRRSITEKGTNLTVKDEKGFNAPSPQKLLSNLIGAFQFSPIDFVTKDEKEQSKILLSIARLEVTPEEVREWTGDETVPVDCSLHGLQVVRDLHNHYYELRRETNAEVKALKGEVEGIHVPMGFDPEHYRGTKLRDLYDELRKAQDNNESITTATQRLAELATAETLEKEKSESERQRIRAAAQAERENVAERKRMAINQNQLDAAQEKTGLQTRIAELEAELKKAKAQLEQVDFNLALALQTIEERNTERLTAIDGKEKALLGALNDKERLHLVDIENQVKEYEAIIKETQTIDLAPLEARVQEFEEKQGLVRDYDRKVATAIRLATKESEAKRLDQVVKTLAEKPQELVSRANLPIQGIGIDDKGNVTISGRPLKNLSSGEQIQISLEIAKATSGALKLVCLDGLERLDWQTRKELLDRIGQDDYQYFVTETGSGDMKVCIG